MTCTQQSFVGKDENSDNEKLVGHEATKFRALAAKLNYLSQDRPDIRFATMIACTKMASPTPRQKPSEDITPDLGVVDTARLSARNAAKHMFFRGWGTLISKIEKNGR